MIRPCHIYSTTVVILVLISCHVTLAFQLGSVRKHANVKNRVARYSSSANNDIAMFAELQSLGFTYGLCEAMVNSKQKFAKRFWIIDDSGSMASPDGSRLASDGTTVACTRWKEVQDAVMTHAKIASILQAPTSFRMLNNDGLFGSRRVEVGTKGGDQDVQNLRKVMQRAEPFGATPLARKIRGTKDEIQRMSVELQQKGQRVALIIATDGLPTNDQGYGGRSANEELQQALTSLQGLPVWLIIRLCTNEDQVVSFYNDLDSQLELSMDVLDDWKSEAIEVCSRNRWINYGLPLHRLREMGSANRVLDILDERKLTKDEIRDYCALILGETLTDGLPDPQVEWRNFRTSVARYVAMEESVFNPVSSKKASWLDLPTVY